MKSKLLALLFAASGPAWADQPFQSMSQPQLAPECVAPKPPRDLAETAYTRNAYRALMRIMAVEVWEKTGSCACQFAQISWHDVLKKAENTDQSSDPTRAFDTSSLRQQPTNLKPLDQRPVRLNGDHPRYPEPSR